LQTLQRKVVIANPNGLHVRPAAVFKQAADRFQSQVTLHFGGRRADGRSVMDLLTLGAQPGAEVVLEVSGPDAAAAIEILTQILSAPEPPALGQVPEEGS